MLRGWQVFASIVAEKERHASVSLGPGDVLVFENHRCLHGRAAMASVTAKPDKLEESRARHLQGCCRSIVRLQSTFFLLPPQKPPLTVSYSFYVVDIDVDEPRSRGAVLAWRADTTSGVGTSVCDAEQGWMGRWHRRY